MCVCVCVWYPFVPASLVKKDYPLPIQLPWNLCQKSVDSACVRVWVRACVRVCVCVCVCVCVLGELVVGFFGIGETGRYVNDWHGGRSLYSQIPGNRRQGRSFKATWGSTRVSQEVENR